MKYTLLVSVKKTIGLFMMVGLSLRLCAQFTAEHLTENHTSTPVTVRFATYNASLNKNNAGDLLTDLSASDNKQAKQVAEVIQRQDPDVLALMEFDFDENGKALAVFQSKYLEVSQNGVSPVHYPYVYVVSSNTGVLAEVDLEGDGDITLPEDAYGFGFFPGQYAFAVLSKYKILENRIRTFQKFLWKDMPDALLPVKMDGSSYYSEEALAVFRLSSKNHVDIPIQVNEDTVIHALVAHPTPTVFDGPEDRNGTRNHDEIRFFNDYVKGKDYMYDDTGSTGGLQAGAHFVIMGDMNADPFDGESTNDPIGMLEANSYINNSVLTGNKVPSSEGGTETATLQGAANTTHEGNPAYDTGDFGDGSAGNLRVDYVVPSATLTVTDSGVFWPIRSSALAHLNTVSDHKLVWVDITL
ncbi:MAG: endonuclease/exonuclease/phosphatase family protein [Bacteroidota bacterium]